MRHVDAATELFPEASCRNNGEGERKFLNIRFSFWSHALFVSITGGAKQEGNTNGKKGFFHFWHHSRALPLAYSRWSDGRRSNFSSDGSISYCQMNAFTGRVIFNLRIRHRLKRDPFGQYTIKRFRPGAHSPGRPGRRHTLSRDRGGGFHTIAWVGRLGILTQRPIWRKVFLLGQQNRQRNQTSVWTEGFV